MFHKSVEQQGDDLAAPYKAKLGVWMFLVYSAVYVGFVLINVIQPVWMETIIVFGLNLAVVYGFGLIGLALILAFVYNRRCASREAACEADFQESEGA